MIMSESNFFENILAYIAGKKLKAVLEAEARYMVVEILPASSKGQRYILLGINYFTKWIKAITLVNVDQEAVIKFTQRNIIYRFGIPETITTDQGSVFTGRKM